MIRKLLGSTAALALTLAAFAVHAADHQRINGDVRVEDGGTAQSLQTVNGSVIVGARATVGEAETVNGSVTLGAGATARSLATVNGYISIGGAARVSGSVEAVNGGLEIGRGAEVGGDVANVNGRIHLDAAHIAGNLSTVVGDIELGAGSKLDGNLTVEKANMNLRKSEPPRVVIGPDVVVGGRLKFEREVKLYVSDRAKTGPIEGATAVRYSGAQPPKD
jgi:predicted acyltransferase (DUF342 family)